MTELTEALGYQSEYAYLADQNGTPDHQLPRLRAVVARLREEEQQG